MVSLTIYNRNRLRVLVCYIYHICIGINSYANYVLTWGIMRGGFNRNNVTRSMINYAFTIDYINDTRNWIINIKDVCDWINGYILWLCPLNWKLSNYRIR